MRFIKSFYKLFESITNIVNNYWNITFNHGINHDLDDKLNSRVGITEKEFELFLKKRPSISVYPIYPNASELVPSSIKSLGLGVAVERYL